MRTTSIASVTLLRPRRGHFDRALHAYRAASVSACLSELHGNDELAADVLRARAQLRGALPLEALRSATRLGDTDRERAELAMLRAVAATRLGHADEELCERYNEARVFAISSGDVAIEAEVDYYLALWAFANEDLQATANLCSRGLKTARNAPACVQVPGVVPGAHVIARLEELTGLAYAADGRYREQLPHAWAALSTLDGAPAPDAFATAFALQNLAVLVRDFDLADDARVVAERADALQWTPDIAHPQFATLEALGWCAALRGDVAGALGRFRSADQVATTVPAKILVGVDRAMLARAHGYQALVADEVDCALRLADGYDWNAAPLDHRIALLTLAQAAAPLAPARARALVQRHGTITHAMDSRCAARGEERVAAEEAYTRGVVSRAEGRLALSIAPLQQAFETWERIGYTWRSALAALELAEMDAGDAFRFAVRRELNARPNSIFATRARRVA